MKKELLAIAFSDLHLHRWKAFSEKDYRMEIVLSCLRQIQEHADRKRVPILFAGDLFHNEKAIDNKLLSAFVAHMKRYEDGMDIIAISGNHDMSEKNTPDHTSPSYIKTFAQLFENFHCNDNKVYYKNNLRIFGIPYLNGNVGLKDRLKEFIKQVNKTKYNILMLHTDLPGATDAFGHVIDEVENIRTKYFKHFDLVLDGHIHKPQQFSKNTFILGPPYQQTRSEKGLDLGYWEIYRDRKPKLIRLHTPSFIDIPEGEPIPDDYNFYTVIPKPREVSLGGKFDSKMDRVKLAKRYLNKTGIEDKQHRKALIQILNLGQ